MTSSSSSNTAAKPPTTSPPPSPTTPPWKSCGPASPSSSSWAFFFVGFKGFINYDTPASNATPIQRQGRQWKFTFTYPNGAQDANLYLEKDVPVRLDMTSQDVLHAFYIPAFRTQRNLIFGRTTYMWFIPEELSPLSTGKDDPGGFDAFCTQYCGKSHSTMGARVYVLDKARPTTTKK